MKKVNSQEEFSNLIGGFLSKNFFHNSQRLIRDYRSWIEMDKLYFTHGDKYRFFYEDKGNFYNLYYFIKKDINPEQIQALPKDKIIITDYIYKEEDREEMHMIESLGFNFYADRLYMVKKLEGNSENYNYEFAQEEDLESIFFLQENNIDPYTGNPLKKESLREEIINKNVLVVYEGGFLAGFLRFKGKTRNLELDNIVVDDKYRGKNMASHLIESFISLAEERGNKSIDLWVRGENLAAIKLYEKFSFKETGYKCINYIKGDKNGN